MLVGICGDIHENRALFIEVLRQMRDRGVTHLIGTGDYSNAPLTQLQPNLKLISANLRHLRREQIYLAPGNWDHFSPCPSSPTGRRFHPVEANAIIRRFGQLVFEDCVDFGFVMLASKRIVVSHYPQNVIPDRFLPPRQMVYGENAYPNQLGTMMFDSYSPQQKGFCGPLLWGGGVHLSIAAHTHLHGLWGVEGIPEVNVGTLSRKKSPKELFTYGLYYPLQDRIEFVEAATNRVYDQARTATAPRTTGTDQRGRVATRRRIDDEHRSFVFLPEWPYTVPRDQATQEQLRIDAQGVDVVARNRQGLTSAETKKVGRPGPMRLFRRIATPQKN